MASEPSRAPALKPADLRGILHYVPMFRGHTFVLGLDGRVIADENLNNLLTDVAVLHSLQIRVILVHGIGYQLERLAAAGGRQVSSVHGTGPTDRATLELALRASGQTLHLLLSGLNQAGLRYETSNALRATERGTVEGTDFQHTGRIEKIDTEYLKSRLNAGCVPVVSPVCYNRDGKAFRLNSDTMVADIAIALEASKMMYLSGFRGLEVDGALRKSMTLEELEDFLRRKADSLNPSLRSKARESLRALQTGAVERAHILDGCLFGGLLTEIFEKEGVGSMIHANAYARIRPARKKDLPAIAALTRQGAQRDALRPTSRHAIERAINSYFVYEIDETLIACGRLTFFPDSKAAEIGSVYVHSVYQGRGIGKKMIDYAEDQARKGGARTLFALSTQNFSFFKSIGDYIQADPGDLPTERRETYLAEKRGAQILKKELG